LAYGLTGVVGGIGFVIAVRFKEGFAYAQECYGKMLKQYVRRLLEMAQSGDSDSRFYAIRPTFGMGG
jgi:hypothetical protein